MKQIIFRIKNGFWKSEVWCLDDKHAEWMLPRIKYLKETTHSHPMGLTEKKWDKILQKMIDGFQAKIDIAEKTDYKEVSKNDAKYKKALELLVEYRNDLWD